MNFSDIFKKTFLSDFNFAQVDTKTTIIALGITCVFALYIFFAYRMLTRNTFYDKSMNISMAVISVIVCGIILTIQSSFVVSLGMVGALSIVRFRTAIKNAIDLTFLFWSISVGIICGAGLYEIAALMSAVVTGGLILLNMLPVAKAPLLLIVNLSDAGAKEEVLSCVKNCTAAYHVKSQTIRQGRLDMIVEVRVKEADALIDAVAGVSAVTRCSLLSHDGEVTA